MPEPVAVELRCIEETPGERREHCAQRPWMTSGRPLCEFLGVAVRDAPFPSVNDRAEVKKEIRGMTRGAYPILTAGAALAGGLVYALARLAG